jgi:hypothetical protein
LTSGTVPNFIVVGVSRAGTTMVFNALSAHPQVCGSSTKETRYFQAVRYGEPLAPISSYEAYFRRYDGEPVVMECTPDYFFGGAPTAQVIKDICDPRVAIILREPISRLISFYRFMQGRLQVPADMTLQQYIGRCLALPESAMNLRSSNVYTGLWSGQYARFLPAWLEAFPGRCDIYFFDDLVADPNAVLADQCIRLGIDPAAVRANAGYENPSAGYRSPTAQRVAAMAAKRSRAVFRRYPTLYTTARRGYEAINQRRSLAATPLAETARREINAVYQPWNELLAQQLRDAGHDSLPSWLDQ